MCHWLENAILAMHQFSIKKKLKEMQWKSCKRGRGKERKDDEGLKSRILDEVDDKEEEKYVLFYFYFYLNS